MKSQRLLAVGSVVAAFAGLLLMLGDAVVRDQAMILAGLGVLAISVALGITLMPSPNAPVNDVWVSVPWGKFFVAIVYASIAVACLVAMAHTPDAARVAHALRAAI